MVKIRYSELPAGLHVAAAADPEGTVVYLQPGLTAAQRRAALTRVRSSARMGQGPLLPRPAMARAIAADRVRTNANIGAAVARRHPMLFLPPVIVLVVSAMMFVFLSIQPLTAVTQRNAAAPNGLATLDIGASSTPSAPASAQSHPAQATPPTVCLAANAASSGRSWWSRPPSRSSSALTRRCIRRFQRWSRTHRH
jgi:hypothetical protein